MTTAADSSRTTKPLAVIIIGADALLAARPASPIQLWHGCLAAGYDLCVPATWGDELVAAEALRALATHARPVAVMCSCPLVARTVARMHDDLSPYLVSLVAPPVAAARYLRRIHGTRRIHITYVGVCPSAADSAIDAWITPNELLERFASSAIVLTEQPTLFDSVIPPDRRRHLSQPGGLPTADRAATKPGARELREIDDDDVLTALDRQLADPGRALVDLGPRVGCACSGAVAGVLPSEARAAVTTLEPPRSERPVMADPVGLGLIRRLPPPLGPDVAITPPSVNPARQTAPAESLPFGSDVGRTAVPRNLGALRAGGAPSNPQPRESDRGRGGAAGGVIATTVPAVGRYWFVAGGTATVPTAPVTVERSATESVALAVQADPSVAGEDEVWADEQMIDAERRALAAAEEVLMAEELMLAAERRALLTAEEAVAAEEVMLAAEETAFARQSLLPLPAVVPPIDTPGGASISGTRLPLSGGGARRAGRAMLDWMAAAPGSIRGRLPDRAVVRARVASVQRHLHRPGDAMLIAGALLLLLVAMVYAAAGGRVEASRTAGDSVAADSGDVTESAANAVAQPRMAGATAPSTPARSPERPRDSLRERVEDAPPQRGGSPTPVVAPPSAGATTSPPESTMRIVGGGRGASPDSASTDSAARAAAAARDRAIDSLRDALRGRLDSISRASSPPPVRPPPPPPTHR